MKPGEGIVSTFTTCAKLRGMVAGFLATVLLGLVFATALIACPMQTEAVKATHPCCAKYSHSSGKKCPSGPTEETCPLILSDSKLGVTKHKLDPGAPALHALPVLNAAVAWTEAAMPVSGPAPVTLNRYLLHRVLRN